MINRGSLLVRATLLMSLNSFAIWNSFHVQRARHAYGQNCTKAEIEQVVGGACPVPDGDPACDQSYDTDGCDSNSCDPETRRNPRRDCMSGCIDDAEASATTWCDSNWSGNYLSLEDCISAVTLLDSDHCDLDCNITQFPDTYFMDCNRSIVDTTDVQLGNTYKSVKSVDSSSYYVDVANGWCYWDCACSDTCESFDAGETFVCLESSCRWDTWVDIASSPHQVSCNPDGG